MKNNTLVFLGFALICLMNMNWHQGAPVKPVTQPVSSPAKVASVPVSVQPETISTGTPLAVIPSETAKATVSVSRPVVIHKLRDRQSEAIDASESGPKVDKVAGPL